MNINTDIMISRLNGKEPDNFTTRLDFQRDRDRIIHSRAFRRLMHKTQIFHSNKGDHYRNRLTHTLEVSQIARSIGKLLKLDGDLIEAISLGHDLGHTPFGHVGERTLHSILNDGLDGIEPIGFGFKHNFQSLRVVDTLEQKNDNYKGLNLTLAVREGIFKHTGKQLKGSLVNYDVEDLNTRQLRTDLNNSFTLEGQVVAIADEIAQITHDIEDGIRGGIIAFKELFECELIQSYSEKVGKTKDDFKTNNEKNALIKDCIGYLIQDVQLESQKRIDSYKSRYNEPCFTDIEDVYTEKCISFSSAMVHQVEKMAKDKIQWIICSEEISQADSKAEYVIKQIFKAYYHHPKELPDYILARYKGVPVDNLDRRSLNDDELKSDPFFKRCICDHIAGMTDQFATREYKKLYDPDYY